MSLNRRNQTHCSGLSLTHANKSWSWRGAGVRLCFIDIKIKVNVLLSQSVAPANILNKITLKHRHCYFIL